MTCGSLFSGIGGFDLGFEQAGIKCEWQVEKDSTCRRVLSRHWPNVEKFEDVKDAGKNNLRPVDVICGGFPCQDLSIAGRRQGLAGERSGLWFEFARIVGELEPRFVVIENVPGLLSSNGGKDFAVILRGLVERGYGVSWRILDAQYFGLAQRRRRVFIVGSLGNGSSARILFEREGVSWDTPTRSKTGQGIAETFAASLRSGGNGKRGYTYDAEHGLTTVAFSTGNSGDSYGIGLSEELAPPLRAGASGTNQTPTIAMSLNSHGQRMDGESETFISMPLLGKANSSHDESFETYVPVFALRDERGRNNDGLHSMELAFPLHCAKGQSEQQIVCFDERNITSWANRSNPQIVDPCHTLHSGAPSLAYTIPSSRAGVRRLTPRECERLQGFPDDFTAFDADGKKISNSARYKMLGNAVAVNVAKFIGKRIVSVLNV